MDEEIYENFPECEFCENPGIYYLIEVGLSVCPQCYKPPFVIKNGDIYYG